MAKHAVQSFLAQDYPWKELIIIDDEDDPSFELGEIQSSIIKYERLATRIFISEKRNLCCSCAAGQVIVHFDSDDWSVPSRITDQVNLLEMSSKAVLGYHTMLFFDGKRWGLFGARPPYYAVGTSLCYRRSYWEKNPFPNRMNIGEDGEFTRMALNNQQLLIVEGKSMMVARVHTDNTSPKSMVDFDPIDPVILPGFNS